MATILNTLVVSAAFAMSAISANATTVTIFESSTFLGNPDFSSGDGGALVSGSDPAYLPDDATSAWVVDLTDSGAFSRTYYYYFDLTGYDLSTIALSGLWGAAYGGTLYLNGLPVSILPNAPSSYESLTAFSDFGSSLNQEINLLEFAVTHRGISDITSLATVAAVRASVLVTSTTIAPVPLPAGLPMLAGAIGLLGLGAARRRRQTTA